MLTTSEILLQQLTDYCVRFLELDGSEEEVRAQAQAKAAELVEGIDFTRESMHFTLPANLTKSGEVCSWALDTPPSLLQKTDDFDPHGLPE